MLQDSFKCSDGTYVMWEVSVNHSNAPKRRGHVKAEIMTKAYAAHPIAGYPGQSRVVVVTQVARRHPLPFLGGRNTPSSKARGALQEFDKLQKQALQFRFSPKTVHADAAGDGDGGGAGAGSGGAGGGAGAEHDGGGSDASPAAAARSRANKAEEKARQLTLNDFELRAVIGRGGYVCRWRCFVCGGW